MEVLYSKKTHRRSRSRKKKPTETVESIVPGRAPVGFVTTECVLMDSNIPIGASGGGGDDDDEDVQKGCGVDDRVVVTATTTATTIENNDIHHSGNGRKQTAMTTTSAERIPMPIRYPIQSEKQLADAEAHSSTTQPPEAIPLTNLTSPPANREILIACPSSSALAASEPNTAICSRSSFTEIKAADQIVSQPMRLVNCSSENIFRDSSCSYSHFWTARSRKSSGELDDIDNLPSSRPISLSSFAVRTHNRNKGSKSWIPFSLEDLDNTPTSNEMDCHIQNHAARPPAQFLTPSATAGNHPLRNVTTIDPRSNVYGYYSTSPQRAHQWPQGMRQQPYAGHTEKLGYYQQNLVANIPHQNLRSATIPHTTIVTPGTGPRMMAPDDISPTKHEEKQALRALQYTMVAQSYLQTGHYPPGFTSDTSGTAQNIHPTNSGTGAGYYERPTGPKPSQTQPPGHIDQNYSLHQTPMIQENGDAHNSGYGPDQIQPSWIPGNSSNIGIAGTAAETFQGTENMKHAPSSLLTQPPVSLKPHNSYQTNVNTSPQRFDSGQQSNVELYGLTKYLNNVITTSQTAHDSNQRSQIQVKDCEGNVHPVPFTADSIKSSHNNLQLDPPPIKNAATLQIQRTPKSVQTQGSLPDSSCTSTSMPLTYACSNGPSKVSPVFTSSYIGRPDSGETISKPANSPQSRFKFKFPPPGLPIPENFQGVRADKSYFGEETPASRLVQSNIWFHTDARGEDHFRQRITEIAREEARRHNAIKMPLRVGEQEGVAEAGTVLLGHVLANLRSYILRDSHQTKGFANFGSTPKHGYEFPAHSARRSFLDIDPVTDPWKLLPRRHPLPKTPLVAYGEKNGRENQKKNSSS
ncbi:hypothetical protein AJ78_07047 [Emergomyces pasteurianus Ep9510]|uniref:Uncharacterized protein n=1 Tax=Emergomyces pasteurianus Ep9510 TaxID=1447872 RepID=A0A1J9Q8S8_9EURO|nr:hypothetical protein AJ78_07047 [Emergomyces pasteurianus Ep9510]